MIVIADDKIQQVFQKGERPYPQDARIIRAEGKTVIPALFDIDTHIGQQGLEAAAQALSNYLYFGVVNISDTGVTLIHGEGLKKLEGEGKLVGPRIFEVGPTFTVVGGHPIPTNRALGRAIDPRTLTQIDGPKPPWTKCKSTAANTRSPQSKPSWKAAECWAIRECPSRPSRLWRMKRISIV